MEKYKEEWMNPESPKYYKGYRYEKDEYGNDCWYDENVNLRKVIGYHVNGIKYREFYYNKNNESHNEDGYAAFEWEENGEILYQEYWLNGYQLTEEEWKKKTSKIETQQPDYLNPESPKYYKGYSYEKDEYGDDVWYDENNVRRKRITYYDNGNKRSESYFNENDEYHNEDGYSYQEWDEYGGIRYQDYDLNDVELTEQEWKDKTSNIESIKPDYMNPESPNYYKGYRYEKDKHSGNEIWFDENGFYRKEIGYHDNGNKGYESYYDENEEYHNEEGYAYQDWDINGTIKYQEYWLNDIELTEQEWKEKTGKIEVSQPEYLNPESPKYYKGYRYEKDEYGDEFWFDENNKLRKEIGYYSNGNKKYESYFNEKGDYHNEEGYAYQRWFLNGNIENQEYWLNGEKLTEQEWKEKTGRIMENNKITEIKMENPKEDSNKHKGLRYNSGKLRYDLLPEFPIRELTKVLTKGAEKYEPYNWKRGMSWSSVLASMKRHISEFENCEDFDKESGCYHMAHVMANAAFLIEFYKVYPQGDDRQHKYIKPPKIGLDIDEVIADWVKHWCEYHNMEEPVFWNFDKDIKEKFELLKEDKEFWLSIPRKVNPDDLPFEPHCYITSRNIPTEWTMEWLQNNGFPAVPVYTVGMNESKVEIAKKSGIDWFVDDRYENFCDLNSNGICTFLMDAKHNRRYNVGYKRIFSLNDLVY